MKILIRTFIIIVFSLPLVSFGNLCSGPDEILDPELFQWEYINTGGEAHYLGTMEIVEAELTIGNDTINTRVYRQAGGTYNIPGPTMKMIPGEKYILQFRNELPYEVKSTQHNVFKDPNVSNLHTHGLHISGTTPGDDVTRSFEGGAGGDFVYDIPADHMGGTFWYHAHHHGSTYLQVSGGAFGMIVVDDAGDNIPASVAAMDERQLVVAYLDPDVAGTGGDTLISGTLSPTWTVNGKVDGKLCLPANTWQHWRVLLADRDAKPKSVTVGSQCEVELLARDGVWRTEVPKRLTDNSINLTGASRADLAVRCSGDSTISVGTQVVANVVVDGASSLTPNPYGGSGETWFSQRPAYLRDLREALPSNSETVNMGARTINGSKYNNDVPTFRLNTDGVQDWKLKGARNHPFHLHIYHVQIQGNCGDYEDGEYYDVVSGNCNIRFDLNPNTSSPYSGRTIMHCHILEHEDQGAMGWADVQGGAPPPAFPIGFEGQYMAYIGPDTLPGDPPAVPSGLVASAISSNVIDLNWTDNSNNETLFNIERAPTGGSFAFIDSVGADSTSYSDTGLTANTAYDYQISASNPDGNSAYSNIASATTDPSGSATSLALGSITVTTTGAGRGLKRGRAIVVVEDDQGNLVADAVVSGEFSGTFTEDIAASVPTDTNGSTTIDTTGTSKGKVNLDFCVTAMTHSDLINFSAAPGTVCGSL